MMDYTISLTTHAYLTQDDVITAARMAYDEYLTAQEAAERILCDKAGEMDIDSTPENFAAMEAFERDVAELLGEWENEDDYETTRRRARAHDPRY